MKQRLVLSLALCLFIASLLACTLPGCSHKPVTSGTPTPTITPILADFQPPRLVQVCYDTYPLVSESLFRAAINRIADLFTVNVNSSAYSVYISYITSSSYLKDAFSFNVEAIAADRARPTLEPLPDPAKFSSPYDYATAKNAVDKKNAALLATWQLELKINHDKLAAARAVLTQNIRRLRSLRNLHDSGLENVAGCLQSASERLQAPGFHGRKTLIIASPLVRMISDTTNGINLAGVNVQVIMWNCQLASADDCIASKSAWIQKFRSFGASSVSILDQQQSAIEKLSL